MKKAKEDMNYPIATALVLSSLSVIMILFDSIPLVFALNAMVTIILSQNYKA